jgi:two-component system, OmpR family, response regulator MprA
MKLLVIEDEPRMVELLQKGLTEEGHMVHCACHGGEGLRMARTDQFDVIILDVMMPKVSGYEVARRLRAENNTTAVLMLTARDSVPDIVHGLDLGADDYMTKPFSFQELLLRLRVVKRRADSSRNRLHAAGLLLDCSTREVSRDGAVIGLTRTEYDLLLHLMCNAGTVVSRESLIESTWGGHEIDNNTLDAFMRLLRNKVDSGGGQKLIQTVRGVGYVIRVGGVS